MRDALAVVAFLWLGGQATLLGMVIQTSTVITAEEGRKKRSKNTHHTPHSHKAAARGWSASSWPLGGATTHVMAPENKQKQCSGMPCCLLLHLTTICFGTTSNQTAHFFAFFRHLMVLLEPNALIRGSQSSPCWKHPSKRAKFRAGYTCGAATYRGDFK